MFTNYRQHECPNYAYTLLLWQGSGGFWNTGDNKRSQARWQDTTHTSRTQPGRVFLQTPGHWSGCSSPATSCFHFHPCMCTVYRERCVGAEIQNSFPQYFHSGGSSPPSSIACRSSRPSASGMGPANQVWGKESPLGPRAQLQSLWGPPAPALSWQPGLSHPAPRIT